MCYDRCGCLLNFMNIICPHYVHVVFACVDKLLHIFKGIANNSVQQHSLLCIMNVPTISHPYFKLCTCVHIRVETGSKVLTCLPIHIDPLIREMTRMCPGLFNFCFVVQLYLTYQLPYNKLNDACIVTASFCKLRLLYHWCYEQLELLPHSTIDSRWHILSYGSTTFQFSRFCMDRL